MNIAINGFGRIGRLTLRHLLKNKELQVVAINDLADTATLAHLMKYDSVHGQYHQSISSDKESITIGGKRIRVCSEKDPSKLPWKELKVDLVLECTGIFRTREKMDLHIKAGARKVLLSAPASGDVKTIVLGVNDKNMSAEDVFLSNASCTTNCLAPLAKVLHDNFGIVKGFMTTTHAYTADQNLQDAPHKDLRRARAAALSIIPTSTGAAKTLGLVMPELDGKLDGFALRVPTPAGSVTDLSVELEREASIEQINSAMRKAAEGNLKGVMQYTEEPLVSSDIIGNPHSCIFDSELTNANGNMVKVVGWYDNETGYAARLADVAFKFGQLS